MTGTRNSSGLQLPGEQAPAYTHTQQYMLQLNQRYVTLCNLVGEVMTHTASLLCVGIS